MQSSGNLFVSNWIKSHCTCTYVSMSPSGVSGGYIEPRHPFGLFFPTAWSHGKLMGDLACPPLASLCEITDTPLMSPTLSGAVFLDFLYTLVDSTTGLP